MGGLVQGVDDVMTSTTAFEYPGSGNVGYASCELGEANSPPARTNTSLADFAFLSAVAYKDPNSTAVSIQDWFHDTTVAPIDHQDIVYTFREAYEAIFRECI